MTRVFIAPSLQIVAPFNDPPGDIMIANRRLEDIQDDAIQRAGFQRASGPEPPCLVVPDNLYFNAGTLAQFAAGAAGRNAVCVLKNSLYAEHTAPVQRDLDRTPDGWRFSKVRFLSGGSEDAVDVVVDPEEKELSFDVPEYYLGQDEIRMGLPRFPLMGVHHWCHILWANQVAPAVEARNRGKIYWTFTLLWAALRALSFNKWKVLAKMSRIGRKCDIHPTAIIEYSTIGEGVTIGAGAQVRFSTVGAGATIMAGALVEFSTVGEKCIVSQHCILEYSVLYPEAVSGHSMIQLSVLGRRAVTTRGSLCIDLNFHGDIRVPLDGTLHSIGQRTLGSAIGHRTRLGTGFWIASGRAIPNDYFIIRRPQEILVRIPEDLADRNPLTVSGGTLVPLTKRRDSDGE
jgi:acetyltransferase-like isoleucine patch superfamily enzyme